MGSRYVRTESPGIRPLPFHFNFSRNQRREFYTRYYSQLYPNGRRRRRRRNARPYYHHQAHQKSGQHISQEHRDVLHRTRRYAGIARRQRRNYPPPGLGKKLRRRRQRRRRRERRRQKQQGPPTTDFRAIGPDGEVLTPSTIAENQHLLQTLPTGYGRRLTYRDIQITAPNPTALFRAVERLRQKRPSPEIKIEYDDYDDEVHLENYPPLPGDWDFSLGEVSYG